MDNFQDSIVNNAVRSLISGFGVNSSKQDLDYSALKVSNFWKDFLTNNIGDLNEILGRTLTTDSNSEVMVKNISFYSVCKHHLLPFYGTISVAYQPSDKNKIIGFTNLVKAITIITKKLSLQEELTREIAVLLEKGLDAKGVAVKIEANQLCLITRDPLAAKTSIITMNCTGIYQDSVNNKNIFNQI